MKRIISRTDADAIRAEIDAKRGFPRVHPEREITRVGGGLHVETIMTMTAVAIDGEGTEVSVMLDAADDVHVEASRRARLRAAKEPVEDIRTPEDRNPKSKR